MKTRNEKRAPSKAKAKAKASKASLKRASKASGKPDSSRAAFDKRNKEARKKALARGAKAFPDGTVRFPKAKASKANGKARKAHKANGAGGGKALSDFGNAAKLRVLKAKEIPARADCFKTGQTVSANLAAQKAKGFRGRRKFIRAQIAQGRVTVS